MTTADILNAFVNAAIVSIVLPFKSENVLVAMLLFLVLYGLEGAVTFLIGGN
jgi:hypothetical protein